ncbi:unnamed protein product [Eruca vesicaria subsp. sativa]|uniref:Uncharacterized protein n=1 Tax=Eruca vesicaria subsp. sativa TaxID=29727 RepID=A0ABC8LAQ7_ERUVS|nr:unnamed protein product [Eruca vesicaria subsp. sativa]
MLNNGHYKMKKLLELLGNYNFPLITRLTESNTVWVYSSPVKLQVMIFSKADVFLNLAQTLKYLARNFKSKFKFIHVNITNENLAMPFLTLFGIDNPNKLFLFFMMFQVSYVELIQVIGLGFANDFCSGLADETVSHYYRSEPVPNNENASIVTLVGKTFDELVLQGHENVFLEVDDFPTILLYKSGEKKIHLKLSTKLSAKDMAVFIN